MKKHVLIGVFVLVLIVALVGCGANSKSPSAAKNASAKFPDKPITWVVPWAPGGANDICARMIAPELEKILGVPVTISNTEGAGGWIGYNAVLSAKADGYTISMASLPGLVANYINPDARRKNTYKDFALLMNFARDYVVIVVRPNETRFSNMKELVAYSKSNEVIVAGTSGPGDDGVMIAQLNGLEGSKFVHLATTGASGSLTNLYGGHVDISVANVSEIGNALKSGQLKVLAVAAEKRVPQLPNVPTVKEEIGISIVADSSRGIITKAGVPENELKVLRDALTKALESTELRKKLAAQGIEVQITDWKGYETMMQETEKLMRELGPKFFGWKLKK